MGASRASAPTDWPAPTVPARGDASRAALPGARRPGTALRRSDRGFTARLAPAPRIRA
jgi:hypothetical protein